MDQLKREHALTVVYNETILLGMSHQAPQQQQKASLLQTQ